MPKRLTCTSRRGLIERVKWEANCKYPNKGPAKGNLCNYTYAPHMPFPDGVFDIALHIMEVLLYIPCSILETIFFTFK